MSVCMIGVTVIWCDSDGPGHYPSGWVAHAVLSDGTYAWPHGASPYTHKALAQSEALSIRWNMESNYAEVVKQVDRS